MSPDHPSSKYSLIQKASSSMLVATIVASIVVSFSIVTLKTLWDQSRFNSRVHTAQEAARDTLQLNVNNLKELSTDFANLEAADDLIVDQGDKSNSTIILDALPSKYDFPALVTSVQELAKIGGVEFSGFNGSDQIETAVTSSPNPQPEPINFTLAVKGDYRAIQNYMKIIDNTIRPIKVTSMSFSGSDRELTASFKVITHYQPAVDLDNVLTETVE